MENNTETKAVSIFKKSDTVYWGNLKGVVKNVYDNPKIINVDFANGSQHHFSYDGESCRCGYDGKNCRWLSDLMPFPSLSFTPYTITSNSEGWFKPVGHTLKRPYIFTKGELCWCRKDNHVNYTLGRFVEFAETSTLVEPVHTITRIDDITDKGYYEYIKDCKPYFI